jgi:hypothetical protein
VVNIASQAGKYGAPGGATYSATKHAVIGLTEAVRGELHIEGSAVELSYVMPFVVKTELGAGTEGARGMKKLEPADVADAIVDALKHGVVDVWVPRSSRHTTASRPPAASRERGVARAMKADRVLMGADKAPAAYELRAAIRAGLEPARSRASSPLAARPPRALRASDPRLWRPGVHRQPGVGEAPPRRRAQRGDADSRVGPTAPRVSTRRLSAPRGWRRPSCWRVHVGVRERARSRGRPRRRRRRSRAGAGARVEIPPRAGRPPRASCASALGQPVQRAAHERACSP